MFPLSDELIPLVLKLALINYQRPFRMSIPEYKDLSYCALFDPTTTSQIPLTPVARESHAKSLQFSDFLYKNLGYNVSHEFCGRKIFLG